MSGEKGEDIELSHTNSSDAKEGLIDGTINAFPTAEETAGDEKDMERQLCPNCCKIPVYLERYLPPRGRTGFYLTRTFICAVVWAALYAVIGKDAWPGGNIFSIYILLVAASLGGFLVSWKSRYFTFPPLLGMLIVGFILRNIEAINIAQYINSTWSSSLRNGALAIILVRSGLGLDIQALKRLKCTVIRLAFGPCLSEAVTVAVVAHLLLGMPWLWAFQLGFILGAVSPAVVVPSMLNLQNDGYGVSEGIPTMVMAASSCDDVLAISLFGVFLGVAFSEGDLYFNIFRGPLEIIMGICAGLVGGMMIWYFPWRRDNQVGASRTVFLLALSMTYLFGSDRIGFPGAGALGVLTLAATASYGWGEQGKASIEDTMGVLWTIFQPLLFGLIGAEVIIEYLDANLVGKAIAVLIIGLVVRVAVTYLAVYGNNMTVKEKLFCTIAWLPKATVQAAIGSLPLDKARKLGRKGEEQVGIEILTIAVLVILITAPIGAVGISLSGPRWLKRVKIGNHEQTSAS